MKEFCNLNGLKSLINEPTCFKNPDKPTCINLILTNRPTYFQLSTVLETGLSDFQLLTVAEFQVGFRNLILIGNTKGLTTIPLDLKFKVFVQVKQIYVF